MTQLPSRLGRSGLALLLALACAQPGADPEDGSFAFQIEQGERALDRRELAEAERRLGRAQQLASPIGRRSPEQARVHLAVARLHRLQGRSRKARHFLGLARFATRASLGPESLEMANVESESARQLQEDGQHDQAVAARTTALSIRRQRLPAAHPAVLQSVAELAWAHHLARQYARAADAYREYLAAVGAGADVEERVVVLARLAWILERAGLPEAAAPLRGDAATSPSAGLDGLPSPEDGRRETMAALRREALGWMESRRYHPDHFDLERQLLVSLRRLDRGIPLEEARNGLHRDLERSFVGFARQRPRHVSPHRYALPFEARSPRRVLRTSEGPHSYDRVTLHALDFELPAGSPVLAARDGRVVRVVRGFDPEAPRPVPAHGDADHGHGVERVIVLHDDETYATYLPLTRIAVEEGERVEVGQRLGATARVSPKRPAFLHFDVRRNGTSSGAARRVVPEPMRIRFADVAEPDGAPLAGGWIAGSDSRPAPPARAAD